MKREELYFILQEGIWAPSADNLQPWRFKLRGEEVDLLIDPERAKAFCDAGYLTPYLSAGAVIENMRTAAKALGFHLHPCYFPESSNPLWVASLRFSKGEAHKDPHYQSLEKRHTNRNFYHSWRMLNPEIYKKLDSLIPQDQGFRLQWIQRSDGTYSELCRLVGRADRIRFENQRLHQELFEVVRFGEKEVKEQGDGLDVRTLGGGPSAPLLFGAMARWDRMKVLNFLGLSLLLDLYAQLQMLSSHAAGLLVAPSQKPLDYVVGGEIMERLWHEITFQGLSVQPMEAIPIFMINLRLNGGGDFTAPQRSQLEKVRRKFFEIFKINDQNGLILFFRMGYASPMKFRSERRPLDRFLEESG